MLVCFLSVSAQTLLACPTIPLQGREKVKALWGELTDGWAVEESTYEASQPCAEVLDLEQVDLW